MKLFVFAKGQVVICNPMANLETTHFLSVCCILYLYKNDTLSSTFKQVGIEPMQVDAQPEENDNVEEDRYVVENTTLVNNCHNNRI